MLAFFLLSFIVTPPFMTLLLYFNITDQEDGRTKEEAQADVRKKLLRYPLTWVWLIVTIGIIFALF